MITEVAIEWFKDERSSNWASGVGSPRGSLQLKGAAVKRLDAYGPGKIPALQVSNDKDFLILWPVKGSPASVMDEWEAGLSRVIKALAETPFTPADSSVDPSSEDRRSSIKSESSDSNRAHSEVQPRAQSVASPSPTPPPEREPRAQSAASPRPIHPYSAAMTSRASSSSGVDSVTPPRITMPSTMQGMAEAEVKS